MSEKRVVVTGLGLASPIGYGLDEVSESLREMRHGIETITEWDRMEQLGTRLGSRTPAVVRKDFPRKKIRTMGRVALLATWATDHALADAGLDPDFVSSGQVGLSYGSTHGSTSELEIFVNKLFGNWSLAGIKGSHYLTFMSHTAAANLALYYQVRGRVITTCSACTSASQGIGYGYEMIKSGKQEAMICGGAEELHVAHAAVFDMLYATSTEFNDRPDLSPRPFDAKRDGLVVGEGAGTLILESYEHAKARGAHIYAEVIGFGTNCDGEHVTRPSADGMSGAMRLAIEDARIDPATIDYVNAHATATDLGDIAESQATHSVFGDSVRISSTKSYTGHTLGACGAIESIFCFAMLRDDFVPPTRNLDEVDPRCAPLDYLQGEPRQAHLDRIMNNNFAFGGINTSLIFQRI